MVIDASAIIACLLDEPERAAFIVSIQTDPIRLLSMMGYVEAALVILRHKGAAGMADLDAFVREAEIERTAIDARQADLAVEAFRRFGKGRHKAGLNIGDCFAYALAKATGEPLLFKGGDFAKTDVLSALA